eukprot:GHVH01017000.1.p1 GENE.GHVH01017000.1~~GHVH01017000.1.p1  ORF type:complete len:895 (+),score=93.53 GHVH01017000.1:230-2914(+)
MLASADDQSCGGLIIENLSISVTCGIGKRKQISDIVQNITLNCRRGNVLGILGASGSGKSTILSFISGRLAASDKCNPTTTSISWLGKVCSPKLLGGMSYVIPCHSELLPFLSAIQSVTFEEGLRGRSMRTKAQLEGVLKSVGISSSSAKRSVNGYLTAPLSEAELRKLGLAMSVTANSEIILFDEPTSFVSESNAMDILNFIVDTVHQKNIVAVVTIHQPTKEQLMKLDQVLILSNNGECAFYGPPNEAFELINNERESTSNYIREVLEDSGKWYERLDSHRYAVHDESHSSISVGESLTTIPSSLTNCGARERFAIHQAWLNGTPGDEGTLATRDPLKNEVLSAHSTNGNGGGRKCQETNKKRRISDFKLFTLMARTFFFRLQNPIVILFVLAVMIIMALLFGATFFDAGDALQNNRINDQIVLPDIIFPPVSDDFIDFVSDWASSLNHGFGPYNRNIFEETLFPPSRSAKQWPQEAGPEPLFDVTLVMGNIQDAFDEVMDVTFCSTYFWRVVDRWPKTYHEVIPNTYRLMMSDNFDPLDSQVVPNTSLASRFSSPMDRMALTANELVLGADYLLHKSNVLGMIDVCLEQHDDVLFWLCARGILREFDGLLACLGINAFWPNHEMESPWATPESDPPVMLSQLETSLEGYGFIFSIPIMLLKAVTGAIGVGGAMLFVQVIVGFAMLPIIITYYAERETANRDTISGSYHTTSFFVAKTLGDFLFEMVPVLIMSTLFCALIGLRGKDFFSVQLMVICVAWAHGGTAYLFTALTRKRSTAMALFSVWTFICLLFSGLAIRVEDMPPFCGWWRYLSPLYWSYGACLNILFPTNNNKLVISNFILIALGVTDEITKNATICWIVLFASGILVRVGACIAQITLHRDIGTHSDYYSL